MKYTVSFELSGVAEAANSAVNEQVMPLLNQAVNAIAQQTRINWIESVQRAKLWSGERDAYAQSITMRMTGPFSAVVETDYKYAKDIETGRPPYDLKRMLNTSQKVRRTKDGRRFLVIPFRHNTPGSEATGPSMPQHVYADASQLSASVVTGQSQRPAGEITKLSPKFGMVAMGKKTQRSSPFLSDIKTKAPAMVAKRNYQWGGRLGAGSMGPNPNGKVDRFAGMVRFDTSAGGPQHSTYMTFRVMMEGSNGWIVPAKPGLYLAQNVAENMKPLAEKVLSEAVRRSFR